MKAVDINVSKGKSTVAVIQPFGVVIAEPFDVFHTDSDLKQLANFIKSLSGETKIVMEYTVVYYEPIANALHNEGIFVTVVTPLLIEDYDINRVRKVKTDKKDSLKIASFAIDKWLDLREYISADDIRKTHKILNRQYIQYIKFLLCRKTILSAYLTSVFQMPTHCLHRLAESLTDTKNGLISY